MGGVHSLGALIPEHSIIRGQLEFDVRFPYEVQGVLRGSGEPEEVGRLLTKVKAFSRVTG